MIVTLDLQGVIYNLSPLLISVYKTITWPKQDVHISLQGINLNIPIKLIEISTHKHLQEKIINCYHQVCLKWMIVVDQIC